METASTELPEGVRVGDSRLIALTDSAVSKTESLIGKERWIVSADWYFGRRTADYPIK